MIQPTEKSLKMVQEISSKGIPTFHHHYFVLMDIANTFKKKKITYVEIGAYAGASAALMLSRPKTNVVSIDTAEVFTKGQVVQNIKSLGLKTENYTYIEGDSKDDSTRLLLEYNLNEVFKVGGIDILFIDGDHTRQGVFFDFINYKDFVNSGGFIVFDDYNDHIHSPEVKGAVDNIVDGFRESFAIIGCYPNNVGAYPESLKESNCFIIQKL